MRRRRADDDWDLTLGTDFSGMETVRIALQNMGYKVNQRFRCDVCNACRTLATELLWTLARGALGMRPPQTCMLQARPAHHGVLRVRMEGMACEIHAVCSGNTALPM